jgi:hypothetical protein
MLKIPPRNAEEEILPTVEAALQMHVRLMCDKIIKLDLFQSDGIQNKFANKQFILLGTRLIYISRMVLIPYIL